ncbi:MAG: matrixin family metalloprotease, partial [Planctomycetota bacterium]
FFEESFDRFSQLSGLSYQYEPNDDGVTQGSNALAGFVGTRADVRIAGDFIDGPNNTLAFNNFPQNGDMTFDTSEAGNFSNPVNNSRFLRNVIMHEHGHGTGYFHVESATSRFLMEPFIQTNFDGPQFDDVLGLHRGYGDFYEKSNGGQGNNTAANATSLGSITPGSMTSIGTDGADGNPVVTPNERDFVSIDDNSDFDFFSFTVNGASELDITVDPVGPTYFQGPQGGGQSSYTPSEFSDLTLQLYDTDGTTLLTTANAGGLGFTENILDFNVGAAGEYFIRVSGAQNNVQMYQLDVAVEAGVAIDPGDFDGNGAYECADVDALVQAIVDGDNNPFFDLTGEDVVNSGDLMEWLALAGAANLDSGNPYLLGDANLDGVVDGADFLLWNDSKFTNTAAWCSGDFNASGTVDGSDYVLWNNNKFTSADHLAVPEPTTGFLLLVALGGLAFRRQR